MTWAETIAPSTHHGRGTTDPKPTIVTEGVLVTSVAETSAAWRDGLRAGDAIVAVNRKPVASIAALIDAVPRDDRAFALNIMRDGARLFIVIR
jgi:S1-C subfamily serine protease